jgi:hypothetical protein
MTGTVTVAEPDPIRMLVVKILSEISTNRSVRFSEAAVEMIYNPLVDRMRTYRSTYPGTVEGHPLDEATVRRSITLLVDELLSSQGASRGTRLPDVEGRLLDPDYLGRSTIPDVSGRAFDPSYYAGWINRGRTERDFDPFYPQRNPDRIIDSVDVIRAFALSYCRIPPFCGPR